MYVRRDRDRKSAAASEYESVWAFGPNCGIDDLDAVLDAVGRCDGYGLDTISTGSAIAFAMECARARFARSRRIRDAAGVRQCRRPRARDRRDSGARPGWAISWRSVCAALPRASAGTRRGSQCMPRDWSCPATSRARCRRMRWAWRFARAARVITARLPTTPTCGRRGSYPLWPRAFRRCLTPRTTRWCGTRWCSANSFATASKIFIRKRRPCGAR